MNLKYYMGFLFAVTGLLLLSIAMEALATNVFIAEFYLALFLLITAGVSFYGIKSNKSFGWVFLSMFFAILLLDTLYIIVYNISKTYSFSLILLSVAGFIISIFNIHGKNPSKRKKRKASDIVIEDIEIEKIDDNKNSRKKGPVKVALTGVKKEKGYLYFIDKDGDISKVKMKRNTKKNNKKNKKRK